MRSRITENLMTQFTKSAVAAAVLGTTALTGAAQAQDGFRFYGSLTPVYTIAKDGENTYKEFSQNGNNTSRIGAWYEMQAANGTLKFNFETALGFQGSGDFNQTGSGKSIHWDKTKLRKIEAIYEVDGMGTIYAGQGSMASDSIGSGTDMSGTQLAGGLSVADTAGGYSFVEQGGGSTGPLVKEVFKDFNAGRKFRVRYDSPEFAGGFVASVAAGREVLKDDVNDKYYDVALRYGTDTGDMIVKAMLGHSRVDVSGGKNTNATIGSVGVLHKASGVSGMFTMGDQSNSGAYKYAKVGVQGDWLSYGKTFLSVDAFRSNDMVAAGDKGTSYGFEAVQKIDSANMEVYFGYHQHGYDVASATVYNNVNAYMLGARWSF